MKLQIMCVRDIKVGAYQTPFYAATIGAGERSFSDAINNPNKDSDMSKHPTDFELYLLGIYDDDTGKFDTHEPKFITNGAANAKL